MGLQLGSPSAGQFGRVPRLFEILLSRALLRDELWFEPYDSKSGNLFAVGQTLGQRSRTMAYIGDLAHAADATLPRIPRQRFCPDTEGHWFKSSIAHEEGPSQPPVLRPCPRVWRVSASTSWMAATEFPNFNSSGEGIDLKRRLMTALEPRFPVIGRCCRSES
jgi:hypothetical protein